MLFWCNSSEIDLRWSEAGRAELTSKADPYKDDGWGGMKDTSGTTDRVGITTLDLCYRNPLFQQLFSQRLADAKLLRGQVPGVCDKDYADVCSGVVPGGDSSRFWRRR